MRETVDILGVKIDVTDMPHTLETICNFIKDGSEAKAVFTPNPEFIMMSKKDEDFKNILNNADLVIPDGIGITIASKILCSKELKRVTGFETTKNLFKLGQNGNISFYFLCGAPGTAELAEKRIREKYPKINIAGTHHGYFKDDEEEKIIEEINTVSPDILFVGLGAPKQEKWINRNKSKLKAKVCMGIGGTFDIFAGKVKEPPKIIQNMGLWWLYRLVTQPTRIKRMLKLPQFALYVLYAKLFKRNY